MLISIAELIIVIMGLIVSGILFYRIPSIKQHGIKAVGDFKVSVIIPARNEEKNLSHLLGDLRNQSFAPFEIICVDDASSDETANIARSFGANVLSLGEKPDSWTGKTWACQNGANAANGQLLLFLDADVRLGRNGLKRLAEAYSEYRCTVSVQPYHKTYKSYEQFSLLFNLIQVAANGTALLKPLNLGLYGPVILVDRSDYFNIGGHESVRGSIVEDMALGCNLKKHGMHYELFVGDKEDISFRMYANGMRELMQGWTKNIASGAERTPTYLFILVFFWIASITSVPIQIFKFIIDLNIAWLILYLPIYFVWAAILAILGRRIGNYKPWAFILFPLLTAFLLSVFALSFFKKAFRLDVRWKGRDITLEDKSCE